MFINNDASGHLKHHKYYGINAEGLLEGRPSGFIPAPKSWNKDSVSERNECCESDVAVSLDV